MDYRSLCKIIVEEKLMCLLQICFFHSINGDVAQIMDTFNTKHSVY